jgi:sec-independent protein translocase protein TatC
MIEFDVMNAKLLDNLRLLRRRLIWTVSVYLLSVVIVFYYKSFFYKILISPILKISVPQKLVAIDILSSIVVPIKLMLYIAFFLQLPHMFFQLWYFITHGLSRYENKVFIVISIFSILMIFLSLILCTTVILPSFCKVINSYQIFAISLMVDIERYYSFLFALIMGTIISFQIPILVIILLLGKIIDIQQLKLFRKYALIFAFIISAIIAPPDILSQFILAIPIYILYEISILLGCVFIVSI